MARSILFVGALVWILAGVVAAGVAAVGAEALERLLPPLTIDTDALRGTVVAVAVGLVAVAVVHAVALVGVRARRRWGSTSAILLAGLLAATFVALAASAAASAVANPTLAAPLAGAAIAAVVAALAYVVAVIELVADRRSGAAF